MSDPLARVSGPCEGQTFLIRRGPHVTGTCRIVRACDDLSGAFILDRRGRTDAVQVGDRATAVAGDTADEVSVDTETVIEIAKGLKHPDPHTRTNAAVILAMIGPDAFPAIDALKEAAEDSDEDVRHHAMAAVLAIDDRPTRFILPSGPVPRSRSAPTEGAARL